MALGQQQNRPVTSFTFDIATLLGAPATLAATVDNANGVLVEGVYDNAGAGYATTTDSAAGAGCTVSVTITAGLVPTLSIVTAGVDYLVGDTIVLAESADFSSLATGTLDSSVATIVGQVVTIDTIAGGLGWVVGDTVQANELSTDGTGSGLTLTVATASAVTQLDPPLGGVPSAFTVTAGGTGYAINDSQAYIGTGEKGLDDVRYSNHDQYELGGAQREYTDADSVGGKSSYTPNIDSKTLNIGTNVGDPSNALDTGVRFDANLPTTKTVLKADLPQWKVQQRDIGGSFGTITVFAEPGVVDRNGYLVGQTLRSEDMTDKARCQANGFFWNPGTNNTGDANQGEYGYCQDLPLVFDPVALGSTDDQAGCNAISGLTVAEYVSAANVCTLVAAVDADCPVGYKFDGGTGCTAYTSAEVNALTQSATQIKRNECIASGNHWESRKTAGTECVQATIPGNFSLVNFTYPVQSGAVDYAKTTCIQYGHRWNAALRTCVADSDHSVLVTKATCVAAGHVWIAGVCYDGADFGDGHNRDSSFQQNPITDPK